MAEKLRSTYERWLRNFFEAEGLNSNFLSAVKKRIEMIYLKRTAESVKNGYITHEDLVNIINCFIDPVFKTFHVVLPYRSLIYYDILSLRHFPLPLIVDFFRLSRANKIPRSYLDFILNADFAYLFREREYDSSVEHDVKVKIELMCVVLSTYYYKNKDEKTWLQKFIEYDMRNYGKLKGYNTLSRILYPLNLNEDDIKTIFALTKNALIDDDTVQLLADILSKKNDCVIDEEDVKYIIFDIDLDKAKKLIENGKGMWDIQEDVYKEILYRYQAFLLSKKKRENKKWVYNFIERKNDILSKIYEQRPQLIFNLDALDFTSSYVKLLLREYDGRSDENYLVRSRLWNRILEERFDVCLKEEEVSIAL